MPRRVARVLRGGLLVLGLVVLLWLPISAWFVASAMVPLSNSDAMVLESRQGYLTIALNNWNDDSPSGWSFQAHFLRLRDEWEWMFKDPQRLALHPRVESFESDILGYRSLFIPLWLLAFICLVWPVTSLIIARRRRKGRGFEVDAKPAAALPSPES